MKQLLCFCILMLALVHCKDDDKDPDDVLKPVVGSWRLIETEKEVDGEKVWQSAVQGTSENLIFRFDGLIVNGEGKTFCCGPAELKINGTPFAVKPRAEVTFTTNCEVINCVSCPVLDLEVSGDQLIVSGCLGPRSKYVRVKN